MSVRLPALLDGMPHPWWQYALVVAALAFIAWCWWIVETD